MWHWGGPVSAHRRLVELIEARIGDLPAAVRVVVELVAFGEPLEIGVLARAGASAADMDAAERAGLLITELAGPDLRVRDLTTHWRTDASEANRLGEAVAIAMLEELGGLFSEPFDGFP